MTEFSRLFSPITIGNLTIKNRILISAHATQTAQEGRPTEQTIDYFAERARGGVGLIVTEIVEVHPTSRILFNLIDIWDDRCLPGLRRLTDAVHSHGASVFCQLHHAGRQQRAILTQRAPMAPSATRTWADSETAHAMTVDEISDMVKHYAECAGRAIEAGYDGVEIHCTNGYLPAQFLSPWSNKRSDDYGGTPENRLRFAQEIVRAVKARIPGKVVGIRLTGDEFSDRGLNQIELKEVALQIEKEGVDYIGVNVGGAPNRNLASTVPPMSVPPGAFVYLAAEIKKDVKVPVYTSHRIKDPQQAEQILEDGYADMVVMTRALIADPELPNKAKQGRVNDIRPCVGCLEGCYERIRSSLPISCLGNAAVGKERRYALKQAQKAKKVAVVGGGPAGLEAARVLRLRGHEVDLFERDKELGGKLRLAASLPQRDELFEIARWQIAQVRKLGVKVSLGAEFSVAQLSGAKYRSVVVAAGAEYEAPFAYTNAVRHYNVVDALRLTEDVRDRTILIVDRDHHNIGLLLAAKFGQAGAKVVLVADRGAAGMHLGDINHYVAIEGARKVGARTISFGEGIRFEGKDAYVSHEGWETKVADVDKVVMVESPIANSSLAEQISRSFPNLEVHAVGDCYSPRRAIDAIHDGYRIGAMV